MPPLATSPLATSHATRAVRPETATLRPASPGPVHRPTVVLLLTALSHARGRWTRTFWTWRSWKRAQSRREKIRSPTRQRREDCPCPTPWRFPGWGRPVALDWPRHLATVPSRPRDTSGTHLWRYFEHAVATIGECPRAFVIAANTKRRVPGSAARVRCAVPLAARGLWRVRGEQPLSPGRLEASNKRGDRRHSRPRTSGGPGH